ncbi:MAG: glutamate 2,3-aminomutase [Clostridia bacterium]|nr:glutamate 2,3-aminomutase [Clostridia bacterium]
MDNRHQASIKRAGELRESISDYLEASQNIETGFKLADIQRENKEYIKKFFNASDEDWNSWKWQVSNRITDAETLKQLIYLSKEEFDSIKAVESRYRWAISPYYISLMDRHKHDCPIRMQAIPSKYELDENGKLDPMDEEHTSPETSVTRRYPDRLIIYVTNQCAMYCRHCQRRRNIGEVDKQTSVRQLERAIKYVKDNKEIRDVLLTGGDALLVSNKLLDWLLTELRSIPHVEIIRIGSRTPVTMPQRITDKLCKLLEKYHPLYLNTHFNHPKEITQEAASAANRLSKAGIPLGNQAVLLNGVNNDKFVMRKLNQELLKIRVRPYYIFHPKSVKGTMHFKVKVQEGIEIMEHLRGYTSGLAIPTYIINAPGGLGKTPILPEYIVSWGKDYLKIRTWEGKVVDYPNP